MSSFSVYLGPLPILTNILQLCSLAAAAYGRLTPKWCRAAPDKRPADGHLSFSLRCWAEDSPELRKVPFLKWKSPSSVPSLRAIFKAAVSLLYRFLWISDFHTFKGRSALGSSSQAALVRRVTVRIKQAEGVGTRCGPVSRQLCAAGMTELTGEHFLAATLKKMQNGSR